jgi:hypothetical protein
VCTYPRRTFTAYILPGCNARPTFPTEPISGGLPATLAHLQLPQFADEAAERQYEREQLREAGQMEMFE